MTESGMTGFGPETSEDRAMEIARAFLRQFWRDEAPPGMVPAKDAYGSSVWRCTSDTAGPAIGQPGRLSFDVDRTTGRVTRLRFHRG